MNPTNAQTEMTEYANAGAKKEPTNLADGVEPLDTLPAQWWNWLWNKITTNNNAARQAINNIRDELNSVLAAAAPAIPPSAQSVTQLRDAIRNLCQTVATALTPGAVLSSNDIKSVSVNSSTGTMLVNALTDWVGTDTIEERVSAVETAASNVPSPATTYPADVSTSAAAVGSSTNYARADHVHKFELPPTESPFVVATNCSANASTGVMTVTIPNNALENFVIFVPQYSQIPFGDASVTHPTLTIVRGSSTLSELQIDMAPYGATLTRAVQVAMAFCGPFLIFVSAWSAYSSGDAILVLSLTSIDHSTWIPSDIVQGE